MSTTSAAFDHRLSELSERLVGPVYVPAVVGGLVAQVIALPLAAVWLAFTGLVLGSLADLGTARNVHRVRRRLRSAGVDVVLRTLVRAILLLATLAIAPVGPEASRVPGLAGYVIALLGLVAAARVFAFQLDRVIESEPAMGVRNLGTRLELRTFFGRARRRRELGVGLICAGELPAGLIAVLGLTGSLPIPLTVVLYGLVAAGVVTILVGALGWSRRFRASDRIERYVDGLRAEIAQSSPDIVVYFSGDPDATYQLNQWMPVIERLEGPVLYVIRERVHLEQMHDTRFPVLFCRRPLDVEVALAGDPKVVLYVANAGRNIHFLRYVRPKHVFLNHGDSDKISSANPVVKVYDKLYVAGQLAIHRYRVAGIDLPDERFSIIGRPHLDRVLDRRRRADDGPPTLLYAPTWEGYFEAADYSSLERMGVALVSEILRAFPDLRIVFKAHPLSGRVRRQAAVAAAEVRTMLRDTGGPHVIAEDRPELDLYAWFDRSDVLLSDISAVVTDFLHTDKPYLVTNPRGLSTEEFQSRFPSHRAAYIVGTDASEVVAQLRSALGDDPLAPARTHMKRRVLGEHANGPFASFVRELDATIEHAIRDAERVRNTFAFE